MSHKALKSIKSDQVKCRVWYSNKQKSEAGNG